MTELLWRAYYEDGTELWQHDADGGRHTYADIERDRLMAFGLFSGDSPVVLVDFRDDANGAPNIEPKRLIWRIRHLQSSKGEKARVHLIGWQRKVAGHNIQSICFISEDGCMVLGGQWQDDLPLRGAIAPLPNEADLT